jgi:heat shock protein HslJ
MNKLLILGGVFVIALIGWFWFMQPVAQAPIQAVEKDMDSSRLSNLEKLTASKWVWRETIMSNDEIILPSKPDVFTLTFNATGEINGTTDCNSFFSTFTLDETKISFGPLGMTKMYCEESQEQIFTSMLENTDFIFFDEQNNLVLLLKYDSGSVIFVPAL